MFEHIDTMAIPEKPEYIKDFPIARFFSKKQSFVWWWYMFLFKEDGVRKQIIAFWTTKTYPDVTVNGENWGPPAQLSGNPDSFSYNGMTTWWYWNGKKFHETVPKVSRYENSCSQDSFDIRSEDVQHTCTQDDFELRFCRDPEKFDLCVTSSTPTPPPVGYKRTLLTKKMGFDALKVYSAPFKGTLSTNGNKREIEGSYYMQNITLNSPAVPWLWGVFHKDDGSYLTHFSSFVGPLMFRRSKEGKPKWDNKFRLLNKNLNYTPKGQETKRFKHVRYNVTRGEDGLPTFEMTGELGEEKLRVVVKTISKTTYSFERKRFWKNKFFYNEFPSEILSIDYTDSEGTTHHDDGSEWTGNSEYSWGILLA